MWGWLKAAVNVVTKVAEVAAILPGPIGMVAGGIAAVGNAVQGNWGKAAMYAASAVTFGVARYVAAVGKIVQKSRIFGASRKLEGQCEERPPQPRNACGIEAFVPWIPWALRAMAW